MHKQQRQKSTSGITRDEKPHAQQEQRERQPTEWGEYLKTRRPIRD